MRLVIGAGLLLVAALLVLGVAPAAAQSEADQGVIIGVRKDVSVPAGQEADLVVVVQGNASVTGRVTTLIAIDADTVIAGPAAQVGTVVAISGSLDVGAGTQIDRVSHAGTRIDIDPGATLSEPVRNLETDLAWLATALGFLVIALWVGGAIAALVAGLAMAGFAATQARRAGWFISNDTLKVILAGLGALIVPPVVAGFLMATLVGIPLGAGLLMAWGLAMLLGYLMVGIWLGERILQGQTRAGHPYGAAMLGMLILIVAGIIPLVTLVALWIGLGAVSLVAWRALRGGPDPDAVLAQGSGWGQGPGWGPPPGQGQGPGWGPPPGQGQGPGYGQRPGWGPPPGS